MVLCPTQQRYPLGLQMQSFGQVRRFAIERIDSKKQNVRHDPQCVKIVTRTGGLPFQYVRACLGRSKDSEAASIEHRDCSLAGLFDRTRYSEIQHLNFSVLLDKSVRRLEIRMNVLVLMSVSQGRSQAEYYRPCPIERQSITG